MYQLRLSHSSWRSQKNIGLLISTSKKLISLFLPITEVLVRYNTDYYERIEHSHQLFAKLIIRLRLYKFYNERNNWNLFSIKSERDFILIFLRGKS